MMAGRSIRIAALAFLFTLTIGPGEAPALDLPGVPSAQAAIPGVPSLPALPTITTLPSAPAPPAPPTAQPAPAPVQQSSPSPAARESSTSSAPPRFSVLIPRESGRLQGGSSTGRSSIAPTGRHLRTPAHRQARGPGRSHRPRATHKALPPLSPSRFGHLGEVAQPGPFSSPFLTGFGDDGGTSGMGWALPLLAVMLPIGLCGFLRNVRNT